jgi:nitrogen fixation/metabolism regulation signal transduction histidine kinase
LVNRAGARLLSRDGSDAIGEPAATLGLADTLAGDTPRLIEMPPRHGGGRWELRRTPFRQEGRSHELVVLSDLSRTLREEERQAWQRLVRVLSHEINNSLAPIRSVSESLISVVRRQARPAEWEDDLARGLEVIGRRAEALGRFMQSYARLARLPAPRRRPLDVSEWVRRVAKLETRRAVEVLPGPPIVISADGDQLDQLLINLITNAVDAAAETDGAVRVQWGTVNGFVEVRVEDEGPGLADTTNLFVPFFTTKPAGTGIGLALSRQIAEGHGGSLALANRPAGRGATATLRLPA